MCKNLVRTHISITEEQKQWLRENQKNFSQFVRDKIDEEREAEQ